MAKKKTAKKKVSGKAAPAKSAKTSKKAGKKASKKSAGTVKRKVAKKASKKAPVMKAGNGASRPAASRSKAAVASVPAASGALTQSSTHDAIAHAASRQQALAEGTHRGVSSDPVRDSLRSLRDRASR